MKNILIISRLSFMGAALFCVFQLDAFPDETDLTDPLHNLQSFDGLFSGSSFTATGTDQSVPSPDSDSPIQEMKWKISSTAASFGILQESLRVIKQGAKEPPAKWKGTTPTMLMKRVLIGNPQKTGQHCVFGAVLEDGSSVPLEENMLSGQVLLNSPESSYFSIMKRRYFWYLGRGFSEQIDDVEESNMGSDGLLHIRCSGRGLGRLPGIWILEIDPKAMYMVRFAQFFQKDVRRNILSSEPEIEIRCKGIKWSGNLCVPDETDYSEGSGTVKYPVAIETFVNEVDNGFLEDCSKSFLPPYKVQTSFSDLSFNPPFDRFFSAGQSFSDDEKDLFVSAFAAHEDIPHATSSEHKNDKITPTVVPGKASEEGPDSLDRPETTGPGSNIKTLIIFVILLGSVFAFALMILTGRRKKNG